MSDNIVTPPPEVLDRLVRLLWLRRADKEPRLIAARALMNLAGAIPVSALEVVAIDDERGRIVLEWKVAE